MSEDNGALLHLEAIAFSAFEQHYNATKRPGWNSSEQHWKANDEARALWRSIVVGIVFVARQLDANIKPNPATLPGLGAPLGSAGLSRGLALQKAVETARVDALPRLPDVADGPSPGLAVVLAQDELEGAEDMGVLPIGSVNLAAIEAELKGDPTLYDDSIGPFSDDPKPNAETHPADYAKWKTRNFGRIYGGPAFAKR